MPKNTNVCQINTMADQYKRLSCHYHGYSMVMGRVTWLIEVVRCVLAQCACSVAVWWMIKCPTVYIASRMLRLIWFAYHYSYDTLCNLRTFSAPHAYNCMNVNMQTFEVTYLFFVFASQLLFKLAMRFIFLLWKPSLLVLVIIACLVTSQRSLCMSYYTFSVLFIMQLMIISQSYTGKLHDFWSIVSSKVFMIIASDYICFFLL